jgi:hypothetical protein
MISGITDINSFERIEKELKMDYMDLNECEKSLKSELEQFVGQHSSEVISTLFNLYKQELEELEIVDKKIQSYCTALSNIKMGYENQSYEIVTGSNLYLNKIKEEIK